MFANLPLTALRTFESAARLQSFKAAAEELAVTPTAVSHQIRTLENWLGVALFERLARGVRLTECGERLFGSLHGALLDIVQSVAQLRPQPSTGSLTLSTTPAFAALWLIPQLGQFYQAHPGIKVRVETSTELLDLQQDASIDLVIRYGYGSHPSLHSQCLLDERFGVYGAPGLLAALDPARLTLITVRWRNSQLYDRSWKAWCEAAGESWLEHAELREYDEEHYALQAAIAGQGLVLASNVLVSQSLAMGLLQPLRPDITVPGANYTALCVPGRERHPPVKAFFDWLNEASASR
ncbi:LysR substrate-binding domain-containing protein [Stutzerimonas stutzeri]|uniref:LysR substrate-binding domain-containing protein n=1 Tax=Stutzerimonas stutzeri TaxID=316 RepID=UPI000C9C75D2|nr:LysR substrate-binding domain-containing protein [Stutzerimonas stutzeri]PNG14871.1 LysR family transcriptional regulator [Stutzerimonas stutzeri]